jgi:tRNA 2-selenouridine synthase SelU
MSIYGCLVFFYVATDQCQAMRNALAIELPETRHRWCKWHVLKKAKESLGSVYTKSCAFKKKLHELVDEVIVEDEFELRWRSLVSEFKLENNEFMTRAYANRAMWAKPYFRETFCAGMTSTQRSESANHMLKTYIARAAPIHLFVKQYSRLVKDREEEEGREEHATKQVVLKL